MRNSNIHEVPIGGAQVSYRNEPSNLKIVKISRQDGCNFLNPFKYFETRIGKTIGNKNLHIYTFTFCY